MKKSDMRTIEEKLAIDLFSFCFLIDVALDIVKRIKRALM